MADHHETRVSGAPCLVLAAVAVAVLLSGAASHAAEPSPYMSITAWQKEKLAGTEFGTSPIQQREGQYFLVRRLLHGELFERVAQKYCDAAGIPAAYRDSDGFWTGFGARARVLIYNTTLLQPQDVPRSVLELTEPRWHGRVALGSPVLGTMATHHTSLFLTLGDERARAFFQQLLANEDLGSLGQVRAR